MPLPRLESTVQQPPQLSQPRVGGGIPVPIAIDRAIQESTANNDTTTFLPSLEGNLQTSDFLLDVTKSLYSSIILRRRSK